MKFSLSLHLFIFIWILTCKVVPLHFTVWHIIGSRTELLAVFGGTLFSKIKYINSSSLVLTVIWPKAWWISSGGKRTEGCHVELPVSWSETVCPTDRTPLASVLLPPFNHNSSFICFHLQWRCEFQSCRFILLLMAAADDENDSLNERTKLQLLLPLLRSEMQFQ